MYSIGKCVLALNVFYYFQKEQKKQLQMLCFCFFELCTYFSLQILQFFVGEGLKNIFRPRAQGTLASSYTSVL